MFRKISANFIPAGCGSVYMILYVALYVAYKGKKKTKTAKYFNEPSVEEKLFKKM
jgi:hypothetical protein